MLAFSIITPPNSCASLFSILVISLEAASAGMIASTITLPALIESLMLLRVHPATTAMSPLISCILSCVKSSRLPAITRSTTVSVWRDLVLKEGKSSPFRLAFLFRVPLLPFLSLLPLPRLNDDGMFVGISLGDKDDFCVGVRLGCSVGVRDGVTLGVTLGCSVGKRDEGACVGTEVEGAIVGTKVGKRLGINDGWNVGVNVAGT